MGSFKDSKIYNINDFINWYKDGLLELSPKYQRNQIWNLKAKSYLIDTIVRGLPVPQIFLRQNTDVKTLKTYREVIDGQQRLTAIIEFVNNEFKILKAHNKDYEGYYYEDLPEDVQESFLNFEFSVELIKSKDDALIYDMFSRVNTNNMTANKQELRNAKFWGEFKVFVYNQAREWRNIFIDQRIFTDNNFARMLDVEFVSQLTIQMIDGITTDSPAKIDEFYKKFDESFENIDDIEKKMNKIRQLINDLFDEGIYQTKLFKNKNYFYSLFTILNNELYSVNGLEECEKMLIDDDALVHNLRNLFKEFESQYYNFKNGNIYNKEIVKDFEIIEKNHISRTTNSSERKSRIILMYKYLS